MMKASSLNSRFAKRAILLSQYDMDYVLWTTMEGQASANVLEAHPLPVNSPLSNLLLDEVALSAEIGETPSWEMFFDGVSHLNEKGDLVLGTIILFISPDG